MDKLPLGKELLFKIGLFVFGSSVCGNGLETEIIRHNGLHLAEVGFVIGCGVQKTAGNQELEKKIDNRFSKDPITGMAVFRPWIRKEYENRRNRVFGDAVFECVAGFPDQIGQIGNSRFTRQNIGAGDTGVVLFDSQEPDTRIGEGVRTAEATIAATDVQFDRDTFLGCFLEKGANGAVRAVAGRQRRKMTFQTLLHFGIGANDFAEIRAKFKRWRQRRIVLKRNCAANITVARHRDGFEKGD